MAKDNNKDLIEQTLEKKPGSQIAQEETPGKKKDQKRKKGGDKKDDKKSDNNSFPLDIQVMENSSITLSNTYLHADNTRLFQVLHTELNLTGPLQYGCDLIKSDISRVIRTFWSVAGFPLTAQETVDMYDEFCTIIKNSAQAYAILLTMWKIQSAQKAQMKNAIPISGALFHNQRRGISTSDFTNDNSFVHSISAENTSFDVTISNATWATDYLSRLSNIYLPDDLYKLLEYMYGNIFVLDKNHKLPVYLNVWPVGGVEDNALFLRFNDLVDDTVQRLAANPLLEQVLESLNMKNDSQFNFTRQLTKDRLYIVDDEHIKRAIIESCNVPFTKGVFNNVYYEVDTAFLGNDAILDFKDMVQFIYNNLRTLFNDASYFLNINTQCVSSNGVTTVESSPVVVPGRINDIENATDDDYADALTQAMLIIGTANIDVPYTTAYDWSSDGSGFVAVPEFGMGHLNVFTADPDLIKYYQSKLAAELLFGGDYRKTTVEAVRRAAYILKSKE